jgi:hypothetical protein
MSGPGLDVITGSVGYQIRANVDYTIIHQSNWNTQHDTDVDTAVSAETFFPGTDVMGYGCSGCGKTDYNSLSVQNQATDGYLDACGNMNLGSYTQGTTSRYGVGAQNCHWTKTWTN